MTKARVMCSERLLKRKSLSRLIGPDKRPRHHGNMTK